MVSIWWLTSTSGDVSVYITDSSGGTLGTGTSGTASYSSAAASHYATADYNPYCTTSKALNYELNITDSTRNIKVNFKKTSGGDTWGIREYVLIHYLCS